VVIPLHDDNPTTTKPRVTVGIMIACTVVYALHHLLLSREGATAVIYALGVIPALLTGHAVADFTAFPPALTVLTSMFVHGGFWHLAGNLLYLWIFGNNVEEAMGSIKYALFYVVSGLVAAGAQSLIGADSPIPMVGASGAIGGVLGAYLVLFPGARVVYLSTFIVLGVVELPAYIGLGMYFLLQVVSSIGALGSQAGGTAYAAHVGGFVAGMLLGRILGQVEVRHPRGRSPANADFMDWR
jgi:membrane associated rhomboid family serine protease